MAKAFVEALKRHSREVAELEGDHADEFLRLLGDLRDRLAGRYSSLGGQGDPIDAFRLRTVIGETEAAIETLEAKAKAQRPAQVAESVDLAIDHIGEELDSLSKAFDAEPLDISISAQKVLADPVQGLLANHFETSVARYGGDLLNGVRRELFMGLRVGDTLGSVTKNIAGKMGPFGQVGKANAERLVRTETSQAYNAAHSSGIAKAKAKIPDLRDVWLHVGSYLCPTCGPIHGTARPKDGYWTIKTGNKERRVAHPPGHPNCTCRVVAMRPGWRAGMERLGYLEKQPDTGEEGRAEL